MGQNMKTTLFDQYLVSRTGETVWWRNVSTEVQMLMKIKVLAKSISYLFPTTSGTMPAFLGVIIF